MLDNNKCILVFGFDEEESMIINRIREEESLPLLRNVTTSMASMTLRNIIEGIKLEVVGKMLPGEKAIIFNNLSDYELDRAIKIMRGKLQIKPIFAVVTPSSIDWTFADLLEHLIEEREFFRKEQKRGK